MKASRLFRCIRALRLPRERRSSRSRRIRTQELPLRWKFERIFTARRNESSMMYVHQCRWPRKSQSLVLQPHQSNRMFSQLHKLLLLRSLLPRLLLFKAAPPALCNITLHNSLRTMVQLLVLLSNLTKLCLCGKFLLQKRFELNSCALSRNKNDSGTLLRRRRRVRI